MKKVLSIDGGGIRGLIPALVLKHLEAEVGKPCHKAFDLIAGTSTGGILAMGLTVPDGNGKRRYGPEELAAIYAEHGRQIFSRSFWRGVSSVGGIADERYSRKPIEALLKTYFGSHKLGEAITPVLVGAYDLECREPVFFKSWRANRKDVAMRRIARATSAAPTYFEPEQMTLDKKKRSLVDGGVFVNNPAVSAYAEARRLWPDETDFMILALGCGHLTRPIYHEDAIDWGMVSWVKPVLDVVLDGQSRAVDYQLNQILGEERFFRLQTRLETANDDMDDASARNIDALRKEASIIIERQKASFEKIVALLGS